MELVLALLMLGLALVIIVVIKIVLDATLMATLINVNHVNWIGQEYILNNKINIFVFVNRIITMIRLVKVAYVWTGNTQLNIG